MISLLCKICGRHWYTANTSYKGKCEGCGGELIEDKEDIVAVNKGKMPLSKEFKD